MKKIIVSVILSVVLVALLFVCFVNDYKDCEVASDEEQGKTTLAEYSFTNPVIYSDVPDPDVISVVNQDGIRVYYMVSTSMHYTPGCCIMKSTDLINWETVSYAYDILADTEGFKLENGKHEYAKGSWAASLKYFRGKYYVMFSSYSTWKSYICITEDIENGTWEMKELDELYYDCSLLFDEDENGDYRVFVIHGMKNIKLTELNKSLTGRLGNKSNKTIIENAGIVYAEDNEGAEGSHIYKIADYYYIFLITWPEKGIRTQLCYRAKNIEGPYEGRVVYSGNCDIKNVGVAQGGLIETDEGYDYAMLFEDHGAVGRTPVLMHITWKDDWPVFEKAKIEDKVEGNMEGINKIAESDDFEEDLSICWQWNHNPDNSLWKMENGWLKLTTNTITESLAFAKNTFTQRTFGPKSAAEVLYDVSNMKNGDVAGLSAFLSKYSYIGIHMEDNKKYLVVAKNYGDVEEENIEIKEKIEIDTELIYLKLVTDYRNGSYATFMYSYDGNKWKQLSEKRALSYDLDMFTGCRFAMFYYSTENYGGNIKIDYFHISEN